MFSPLRSPVLRSVWALAALALAIPATAGAAEGAEGPLGPELTELATPALASASPAVQAEAIGVPAEGPGSLVREGGRIVVEAHFEEGALARLEALRAAGAKIEIPSRRDQTVALSVAPEDLEALAEVPGLSAVEVSHAPIVYGVEESAVPATTSGTTCEGGSVVSQGLEQLNVKALREATGALGHGETIGVISDSFNKATTAVDGGTLAAKAAKDEETGDLPGASNPCNGQKVPVRVLEDGPSSASTKVYDEGRAMLQVIHDLAPEAELAFATAYSTELQFAANIERLAEPVVDGGAGADVIVDDIGYFAEPFFQDGPVAAAISKVTEAGVVYLTAAGNDNLFEGSHEIASWERSEFHDTSCPSVLNPQINAAARSSCMNFSPTASDSTFGITVEPHSELIVDLQWAEPWNGVHSDLDAYLLNHTGTSVLYSHKVNNVAKMTPGNPGEEAFSEPVELLFFENTAATAVEVQLVIDRCSHACNEAANAALEPRLKVELLENGKGVSATEYPESNSAAGIVVGPTVYGHAGSSDAITLGAVNYAESATAPKEPERYSSRGPVTHYFGPVDGTAPATALASPEVIQKPNLTTTDCASTTFFATHRSDGWHFCGTSEAGPHAAAVAALMEEAFPLATDPVGPIETAMEETATCFTTVDSAAAVGAGMLDANAAMTALSGGPVVHVCNPAGEESGPPGGETPPTVEPAPRAADEGSTSVSAAGTGSSGTTAADTTAPTTTIIGPRAVRTRRARAAVHFTLKANESPVTFYCQFDREAQRVCGRSISRRFAAGPHVLKVWAEDASGNRAARPAVLAFRVKRIRR